MSGISIISDIHVKNEQDDHFALLMKYLKHPVVNRSSELFLLGDIFDLMVGGFARYRDDFPVFFGEIKRLMDQNIKITYLEGNHDFHASQVFLDGVNPQHQKQFTYCCDGITRNFWNKSYYFTHGDRVNLGDPLHVAYTRFIRSGVVDGLVNKVLGYEIVKGVGDWASDRSRDKNHDRYSNPARSSGTKALFRQAVLEEITRVKCDFFICGHSHIKDLWELPSGMYVNNGYAPLEKSFIHIDNNQVKFIDLN